MEGGEEGVEFGLGSTHLAAQLALLGAVIADVVAGPAGDEGAPTMWSRVARGAVEDVAVVGDAVARFHVPAEDMVDAAVGVDIGVWRKAATPGP